MVNHSSSLAGRIALAMILMVLYYVLALGIAIGLLAVPVLEVTYLHRLHIQITLFCLIGGGIILWSLFPRAQRFEAPGPQLTPRDHPRLFAELNALARASGQQMPAEVYLVDDVNAWVSERSGAFGLGRRRIIGLGLPLMRLLSIEEFRGVLAHEFGHYHGGDTGMGGLVIHRTRSSIGRTIGALEGRSLLSLPFRLYGAAFMRITQAIARRQEFAADRFAAQHAGVGAIAAGLRKVHGAGPAYAGYWHSEAVPVLRAGFRPPLLSGYLRFLEAEGVRERVGQTLSAALEEKSDPYASHPSLRERLAALGHSGEEAGAAQDGAISLLGDPEAAEQALLRFLGGPSTLTEIAWEDVGERVFAPMWQNLVSEHAHALQNVTPRKLPELLTDGAAFGFFLKQLQLTGEQRAQATWLLSAALGFQLHRAGWHIHSLPGEPIVLTQGELRFEPHAALLRLSAGREAAEADLAVLEAAGIADASLATGAAAVG